MNKNLNIRNSTAEFLIFTSLNGEDSLEVKVADETVWLTQKLIAELDKESVCRVFRHAEEKSMRKFGNSEFSTKPTNYDKLYKSDFGKMVEELGK